MRTGEAPRSRRTARLSDSQHYSDAKRNRVAQPKAQMATSTRPRTATPTRTPGAAGRRMRRKLEQCPEAPMRGLTVTDDSSTVAGSQSHSRRLIGIQRLGQPLCGGSRRWLGFTLLELAGLGQGGGGGGAAAAGVAWGGGGFAREAVTHAYEQSVHRRSRMFDLVRNRTISPRVVCCSWRCRSAVPDCGLQQAGALHRSQAAPKTFAFARRSRQSTGRCREIAESGSSSRDFWLRIGGHCLPGNAAEDKRASLTGFAKAYQVMNRWRKLSDGSECCWSARTTKHSPSRYEERGRSVVLRRPRRKRGDPCAPHRPRRDRRHRCVRSAGGCPGPVLLAKARRREAVRAEIHQRPRPAERLVLGVCARCSPQPLGPLVAFATEEGFTIKPDAAQPFYGYYFRRLDSQGRDAKGGAKPYVVNGKMTGGFAYVAYPAKYDETGMKTFIINQDQGIYEKNLGKDTADVAKAMTEFNPDKTWTPL